MDGRVDDIRVFPEVDCQIPSAAVETALSPIEIHNINQRRLQMSHDISRDFSRRLFLRGLGAGVAASAIAPSFFSAKAGTRKTDPISGQE